MIGHYLRKKHARRVHLAQRIMYTPQRVIIGADPSSFEGIDWSEHHLKYRMPFIAGY